MTSTDRAKAFISSKLRKTALIILPLAAAAVTAHAGVILNLGSGGSMQASGNASTSITTQLGGTQILNGVNGISMFGAATFTSNASGFSSGSFCVSMCAGFAAFGTGSGTFDSDTLLVNYDFILTSSNGLPLNWGLFVYFNDFSIAGSTNGSVGAGGGEATGGFTVSGLSGVTLTNWNAYLEVDFEGGYGSGDTITVNVPAGASVDIGASAVPEPGTGMLFAGAGAALAGLRFIRRRLS